MRYIIRYINRKPRPNDRGFLFTGSSPRQMKTEEHRPMNIGKVRWLSTLLLAGYLSWPAPTHGQFAGDPEQGKNLLQLAAVAYQNDFPEHSLEYLDLFRLKFPESPRLPYAILLSGLNRRKLNQMEEARELFTALIEDYPDNPYRYQGYYMRAEIALSLERHAEAEEDFEIALAGVLPEEILPAAYRGLLLSRTNQGKFSEALTLLHEWQARYPDHDRRETSDPLIRALENKVITLFKQGDWPAVYYLTDLALQNFAPDSRLERTLFYRASAWWQEENLEQAKTEYRRLVNSADPEIAALSAFRLGDIFLLDRDYERAENYYRQAGEITPDHYTATAALFQRGLIARRTRDYNRATKFFQQVLAQTRDQALEEKTLFELAGTIFLAGDYQQALNLYRQFQRRFPESSLAEQALLQEAFCLYNLRHYPEAVNAFQRFRQRYPSGKLSGQAHYGLGLAFLAQNLPEKAADTWQEFLGRQRVLAEHAPMVLMLSRFLLERNRPAEAIPYLKRISGNISLETKTRGEAFLLTGLAYLKTRQPDAALVEFESGLNLEPDPVIHRALLKNKADLLLAREEHAAALPLYEQLRRVETDKRGEVLYGYAVCLQKTGKTAEAIPAYLEALVHLPPDSPLVKEVQSALNQLRKR